VIDLPVNLPAELVPLSWLIGVWEVTGVVNYAVGEEIRNYEFGHRMSFTHDGLPHLNYTSYTWLLDDDLTPLATETGYWRLSRQATEGDPGADCSRASASSRSPPHARSRRCATPPTGSTSRCRSCIPAG
jgi:hypothetical protein